MFTLSYSEYKTLDYISVDSKYGSFSTCGETAILNIINILFRFR